jgi:serine protease Do
VRPVNFAGVVEKVRPAVISISARIEEDGGRVRTKRRIGASTGSGFFISADGYAVTNVHVVKPERTAVLAIRVRTADGLVHNGRLIGADPLSDLALIKVDGLTNIPYVSFAATPPHVGDWAIVIGSPAGLTGTVTTGIVSAEGRDLGYGPYDFIQIDASTNQGSSGGPTFDLNGDVVGVNIALWRTPGDSGGFVGIGFAVPVETAKMIVAQLRERGSVVRAALGVELRPRTEKVAVGLATQRTAGALVIGHCPRKGLDAATIDCGDVITSINGREIQGPRDLARQMDVIAPDTLVEVGVLRKGEGRVVRLRLGRVDE